MKKLLLLILVLLIPVGVYANQFLFGTPVAVSVTTTPAVALAANSLRAYLLIVNTGATPVIVKFGSAPASGTDGVPIPAGGNYEPFRPPANSVYVRTASSTSTLVIVQGQ